MRKEKGEKIIFLRKVFSGERFEFSYIHSVDKTPVLASFLITSGKRIKPLETQFESFGPGLPSMEKDVKAEGGKLRAKSEDIEMDSFSFFVSPMTQQTLRFRGERLDFSSYQEGEVISIQVKSYPLLGEVFFRHGR